MRLVRFVKYIVAVCFASILVPLASADAADINCKRTSSDITGFKNYSSMESWFPKNVSFDASIFSDKSNSTSMTAKQGRINITLLKNGKLMAQIDGQAGYQPTAVGRYKCDMNPSEVRIALNNITPNGTLN